MNKQSLEVWPERELKRRNVSAGNGCMACSADECCNARA